MIFPERDIQLPVQLILDRPVAAVIRRAKTSHSSAPKTSHHMGGTGWKNPLIRSWMQGVGVSS